MNRHGDFREEVQAFYDERAGAIRGYLIKLGTPNEVVDDIVNDSFLAAAKNWARLSG